MTEAWTKWESLVVNGVFPLRRFLNRSNHSVVFLTEHKDHPLSSAAIKLVPADPVLAEAQLSYWKTAAALSHPHLMRVFDSGRCQLGGHPFLFVVMEHADQTLAQLLVHRALTVHEAREMLTPALSALAYLHGKSLVQGQVKPPNFLVVNDQLKLASDNVRPFDESRASVGKTSLYDPPEAKDGRLSAAGDVWALGITIVEALAQRKPEWSNEQPKKLSLPATMPPEFDHTVRQCLSSNPADRPTVAALEAQINHASISEVSTGEKTGQGIPAQQSFKKRLLALAIVVAILIVLAAILTHLHPSQGRHESSRAISATPTISVSPTTLPVAAAESSPTSLSDPQPAAAATSAVLHQEIPEVSRGARESIDGHINVTIRVTVDRAGNVVDEALENPGFSKYFAGLASQAARKWQFVAADNQDSREWLLRFEFTRDGVTGNITAP